MKNRILTTTFLAIFIIACGHVDKSTPTLKTGWYYVSEQETKFKKELDKSSEFYFINQDIIIPVEQFEEIEIIDNYNDTQYPALIIRFNRQGKENWSAATEKAVGSRLALIINDKLVSVAKVNMQITAGFSSLSRIEYSKQDMHEFIEQIENDQNFNGQIIYNQELTADAIYLPEPKTDGTFSVEKALTNRRSHRQFLDKEISAENLSQILWAAYGITLPNEDYPFLRGGFRTAPSAGGLYPLEIYVAIGKVKGIESGVYKYFSKGHKLVKVDNEDIRKELCEAALGQKMVEEAPASIIYTAIFSRMTKKYGQRGQERYVCMDLGHSAENVYLQVETLGLGTCAIGAFIDEKITKVLRLPKDEEPLYIMPIGYYYTQSEF